MSSPPVIAIAIVDDDREVRAAIADLLQVTGFESRTFHGAQAFLAAHAPGRFAGVITDVQMAGMSGLELLARLRLSEPDLPVIVVSSASDPATRRKALAAGATAVLSKPFRPAELLAQLRRALGREPRT